MFECFYSEENTVCDQGYSQGESQSFAYDEEMTERIRQDVSDNNMFNETGSSDQRLPQPQEEEPGPSTERTDSCKQNVDLTNSALKRSVQRLSKECAAKRPCILENRNQIYKHQQDIEKLTNRIEMLEYNKTESFNIFTEMKESCEALIEEQKRILLLIDSSEAIFEHAKNFVLSCKCRVDKLVEADNKRQLLYNFTLQDIKNKGSSKLAAIKKYLNKLNEFIQITCDKESELSAVDFGPLEEVRTSHKQLLQSNNVLNTSLEEAILKKDEHTAQISMENTQFQLKIDNLKLALDRVENEINDKECVKLKQLSEERKQIANKLQELTELGDRLKSDIGCRDNEITEKLQKKEELSRNNDELSEILKELEQRIAELDALEPILSGKRIKLDQLKDTANKLESELQQAETDLATNTEKLNQITPLKSDLELAVSNLEKTYQEIVPDIETCDSGIMEAKEANEEIRKQFELHDEKLSSKTSLARKEKDFLESVASSYQRNCDSLRNKLQIQEQEYSQLYSETCTLQQEINRIPCEISMEEDILMEMNERDSEDQRRTIAKFKELQGFLEALDQDVMRHKEAKESLSEAIKALSLQITSQLQERKNSVEETKTVQKSEIKTNQKDLSAVNSEFNKLCLQRDDVNRLLLQMDNNKDLFECKEMQLKSHIKWSIKQFSINRSPVAKPLKIHSPLGEDVIPLKSCLVKDKTGVHSQTKVNAPSSKTADLTVNISTKDPTSTDTTLSSKVSSASKESATETKGNKAGGRKAVMRKRKAEDTEPPQQIKQSSVKEISVATNKDEVLVQPKPIIEINSDLESLSPIHPEEEIVIVKTQISQASGSKEAPTSLLSKIPFFMNQLTNKGTKFENKFVTTESSSVDSPPTIEIIDNIKAEKTGLTTSTPKKELEDADSDYSFTKSLKQTNKVLLKSRVLNKERSKTTLSKKAKINTSVICLDTDSN